MMMMTDELPQRQLAVSQEEFLSTGRTGRRNALGDILDQNSAFLSTADLPDQLQALSFESSPSGGKCIHFNGFLISFYYYFRN